MDSPLTLSNMDWVTLDTWRWNLVYYCMEQKAGLGYVSNPFNTLIQPSPSLQHAMKTFIEKKVLQTPCSDNDQK